MIVSQQDDICWIGDSMTTGFGAGTAAVQLAVAQKMTAAYPPPGVPTIAAPFRPRGNKKWPNIIENATSGRKTTDIGATMATFLASTWINKPTCAIIQLGIPDVVAIAAVSETLGQMQTATFQIVDALLATYAIPYNRMAWMGPWANNGLAQSTLDAVKAQLVANALTKGFQFVDMTPIPYTGGNSTDGIHATPQGALLLATLFCNAMTFTA